MWQNVINAESTGKVYGYSGYFFSFSVEKFPSKKLANKEPSLAPSSHVLHSLS